MSKIDGRTKEARATTSAIYHAELVAALASNPEVYKGRAQDAASLPVLAYQILEELKIAQEWRRTIDEANQNGL